MKHYTTLLFDFDDTLIDFRAAEKVALPRVFESYHLPFTEEVKAYYHHLNESLWRELEKGTITREQLLKQRFQQTMEHFGHTVDGTGMDEQFRAGLAETIVLIEGAREVVEKLSRDYDIYIVTNGVLNTQKERLRLSGLSPFIKRMFVSEETGFQKPQVEFFNYVFERIGEDKRNHSLIIGDSYSADMLGGHNAGIDTCWYNVQNKPVPFMESPTYTIQKLEEILSILTEKVHLK